MSADTGLRDLPPGRAVLWVAWPVIIIGWVRATYLGLDAWWVGGLGDAELTGLTSAAFAWWIGDQACELAGIGTQTRVAQAEGAGRREEVGRLLAQGIWVALAVAVALALVGHGSAELYFDAIGLEPGSAERRHGVAFLTTMASCSFGLALFTVVGSVFRGLGQTRTSLAIAGLTLLLNVVLDAWLIDSGPGRLGLGVAGAALATGASTFAGGLLGLVILGWRGLSPVVMLPRREDVLAIVRIGGPISTSWMMFSLVYVALGRLVTSFGPQYMAALGVGHRLESYGYLLCMGMMAGTSTMVGQHLGAGDVGRAEETVRAADRWTMWAMIPTMVLGMAFAEVLYAQFTDSPDIRLAGAAYLRIQVAVSVFMAWEIVYEGGFAGAGHTWPAMTIGMIGTAARIPLAWALSGPLGVTGIWVAVALSTVAKGVAMRWWFWRRTWVGPGGGSGS